MWPFIEATECKEDELAARRKELEIQIKKSQEQEHRNSDGS